MLSESRQLQDWIETEIKGLKQEKMHTDDTEMKLEKLENALALLKTKAGIYEKPMLVPQISYLYSMLNDTDQKPGRDAYERYEELKAAFGKLEEGLKI